MEKTTKGIQIIIAELEEKLGSTEAVAAKCGVSYFTIRNWRRAITPAPFAAEKLLRDLHAELIGSKSG